MENLSLMIVTDDREYGRALGQAVQYVCSQIYIQILKKERFFFMKKMHEQKQESATFLESVDLILWDGKEAESAYGGRIVLLSEKAGLAVKKFQERKFCIYKYSPAQCIVASLFEIYSFLTGRQAVNIKRRKVNLLAFCSCIGGSGCTTLAMATAHELCRFQGKKVLYISFEENESTGEFIQTLAGVKGVGVYLYHLFKNNTLRISVNTEPKERYPIMESYLVHDDFGLEAFAPTRGRNPLRDLTDEELDVFIASLIDSGRYDAIVMDLGNCISGVNMSCIEMAEKICFISKHGNNTVREFQYLQYLMCCCGEKIIDKIIKTENMADTAVLHDTAAESTAMIDTAVYIEKSNTFLQEGEIRRIFLDGGFGQGIKELTEKLM